MDEQNNRNVEIEKKEEKRSNSSMVGVAFIKYTAYLVIFFGVLWFLIHYILPIF